MNWFLKRDLPSVKENIKAIADRLFEIIHKYATGQNCTGDNAELVMSAFKVVKKKIKHFIICYELVMLVHFRRSPHTFVKLNITNSVTINYVNLFFMQNKNCQLWRMVVAL